MGACRSHTFFEISRKFFSSRVDFAGLPFDVVARARWTRPFHTEEGDTTMSRYMLIMRSTPEAEQAMAEQNIDFDQIIEAMGRYNEELIKAGVMLAGEGLTGPDEGFVVDFNSDPPVVTDGPYTEAKELFNGFWLLDVSSKEEAKQWAQKCPLGPGVKLEVRRVSDTEEFDLDNPWVQKEIQWRAELAQKVADQARKAADR
jgi:hypothetical protein